MITLARPDYIVTNERGSLQELYCKNCGAQIGGLNEINAFVRYRNYVELKLLFDDGSHHVTNICAGCVDAVVSDAERMQALHDADIAQMHLDNRALYHSYVDRINPRCIAMDDKQRGIA